MAECKDIDKALANLARKIDAQNACCEANKKAIADLSSRMGKLEQGGSNKQGQNKPTDLTEVYRRLSVLESYCASVEDVLGKLKIAFKEMFESLDFIGNLITGIFK